MSAQFNLLHFFGRKFKELGEELSRQLVSKYFWRDLLVVFAGVLIYTVGFSFLIYPQRVTTGGLMGISNIITIITGVPVDVPYNLINITLLVIAFLFLDKNFFIKTLIGIGLLAVIVPIATRYVIPDPSNEAYWHLMVLKDQPLLALILGSMMTGLGLGFVFSVNGSTGGTDVIVALISRYRNMSFSRLYVATDSTVVLFSFIANVYLADIKIDPLVAFDKIVMSFIQVVLLGITMDWYTSGNRQSIQFLIFSQKYKEINDAIISRLHRGCTILEATGGYTGQSQKVLLVVVRKQQSVAISRVIEEIDPKAFVSQGAVKGVYGQGFESLKSLK
nr:YitT family protein [uncultured Porphyromonas sp.]